MVYKYKGTRYKVPAQTAGEYLEGIVAEEGALTARMLLEKSRPEDALLHDVFEWDDSEAAEKYRLAQARGFINNLISVEIQGRPVEKTRAFVSVSDTAHAERGMFKPITVAMSNVNDRDAVLRNALRDMELFADKYRSLTELTEIIHIMDEFVTARKRGA